MLTYAMQGRGHLLGRCQEGRRSGPLGRKETKRVGKLAHGPLRNRCPRAAPNPLCHFKENRKNNQWANRATVQGTRVVVLFLRGMLARTFL